MYSYSFLRSLRGLAFAAFILVSGSLMAQNAGIFQTYIILDINGTGNQFLAGGINSDGAPTFAGQNFGTLSSLVLNGGEIKTFKNSGGDVTGAEINYRVYEQGTTPGSFNTVNLPFDANLPNPGDQRWQQALAGVDLLSGLSAGNYDLEVFWRATTNIGDQFDSNFGSNFTSSFSVAGSPTVPTMSQWGLIIFGLTVLCIGGIFVVRRFNPAVAA